MKNYAILVLVAFGLACGTRTFCQPFKGPEPISMSSSQALRKHTLVCTGTISPKFFNWKGVRYQIDQVWVEKLKYSKTSYLCMNFKKGPLAPQDFSFRCDGKYFALFANSKKYFSFGLILPSGSATLPETICVELVGASLEQNRKERNDSFSISLDSR